MFLDAVPDALQEMKTSYLSVSQTFKYSLSAHKTVIKLESQESISSVCQLPDVTKSRLSTALSTRWSQLAREVGGAAAEYKGQALTQECCLASLSDTLFIHRSNDDLIILTLEVHAFVDKRPYLVNIVKIFSTP